jgi:hypothetical protein
MAQTTQDNVVELEAAVVERCRRMLKSRGAFFYKTQGAGLPDLICCYKGVFMGLEVKRPVGRHPVSPRQRVQLERIRKAGGVGIVVRNTTYLSGVLDKIDEGVAAGEPLSVTTHFINKAVIA